MGGVIHASHMEVVAHRGASAYAPEHTFAAYDLALEQGADTLELDVRATGDGELVVVHDRTLLRTAGDPRRVDAVRYADLPPLTRPLRLAEVLDRYGSRARWLVELKDPSPAWELGAVAALDARGLTGRATVQSFDAHALRRLHAAAPHVSCAVLSWRSLSARRLDALATFATGVGVLHRRVDARLVAAAHARGLAIRAWTVNAPADLERVVAAGADAVITDVPDVAATLVHAAGPVLAAA